MQSEMKKTAHENVRFFVLRISSKSANEYKHIPL